MESHTIYQSKNVKAELLFDGSNIHLSVSKRLKNNFQCDEEAERISRLCMTLMEFKKIFSPETLEIYNHVSNSKKPPFALKEYWKGKHLHSEKNQ